MKTFYGFFRKSSGELVTVKVVRNSREFCIENGRSGEKVKVIFPDDPMHLHAVWTSSLM